MLILVRASRSQSSRIKSYQMHFPSSVNGSLLTPSFLRGDCPKQGACNHGAALTIACKVLWVSQFMQTSASHQLVPPGRLPPASTVSLTLPQFFRLLYAPKSSAVPSLTSFTYLSFSKIYKPNFCTSFLTCFFQIDKSTITCLTLRSTKISLSFKKATVFVCAERIFLPISHT